MGHNLVILFSILWAVGAYAEPRFTDRTGDLGLTQKYTGGWEYFVGGGVASFDCNGDLFPELFIAGGASPARLLRNKTTERGKDFLLVPETPSSLALTGVTGAYPLDINSDGILDLFILRVGANQLLKGGPNCTFDEFQGLGFDGGNRWTTAFSATWEEGNRLPTLAIGNYVDRDNPNGPFEACDTNILMRPKGGGYKSIRLDPGYCPLSMLFSDWGRRGRQDLRVSNDRHYYVRGGREQMWAMEAKPRLYGAKDGWKDFSIWGMGIASRDISGDGVPEVFLTSMGDQKLQIPDTSVDGPTFLDVPYARGTTAQRPYTGGDGRPSTGWQAEFGDVDNDGRDDIFIAKGNVEQMPDSAMADPNNLLMQNEDGSFTEKGLIAGIAAMQRSRGAALVDLNLDGRLDLVVVNRRAPVEVYQNSTPQTGNWLLLNVRQTGINPQAVGAWIEVTDGKKTWYREITVGGGHASGNATLTHFGLGGAETTRVRVIWPGGVPSNWLNVDPNQILRLERIGTELIASPL
jgi:enediyne biosynthesis protein E4